MQLLLQNACRVGFQQDGVPLNKAAPNSSSDRFACSVAKALLRCISVDSVTQFDKKTFSSLVPRQGTFLSRVSCEEPQSFESKCYLPVGFSKKSFESTAFLSREDNLAFN
ncbi:hypothetical protein CDAR_511891 [Caerostris darwini]|uniref:Uncharacterized protein n=1 Tax=Caerostris darwini TaxID=1538125 RepID=A0AAV4P3Y6_9ARAC|nr:hypothetical protein CDAR_511891 [Caerostris darwini]